MPDADPQKRLVPDARSRGRARRDREGLGSRQGEFVVVEDADLEAIQLADDSRAIDITRFVPLDQVDPVYFDRTYYLSPANTVAQRRPYVLLLEALKDSAWPPSVASCSAGRRRSA
jgi:non-homologous end joining protein Ku